MTEAKEKFERLRQVVIDNHGGFDSAINNYIKELEGIQRQLLGLITIACVGYIDDKRDKEYIQNKAKEIIGRQ